MLTRNYLRLVGWAEFVSTVWGLEVVVGEKKNRATTTSPDLEPSGKLSSVEENLEKAKCQTESNYSDWRIELLEGRNTRLKLGDKEDLDFFVGFWNDLDFYGEYEPIMEQMTKGDAEKRLADSSKNAYFIIQKKDGANIGLIAYFGQSSGSITIGYAIKPSEHGKGYGTEALQLMVDYLFLAKEIHRVQANTDPENKASQRILEKVGFKKEGVSRKSSFVRGQWRDTLNHSILREEWKEPRMVTRTT